jgi:hypothetical protein
MEKLSIDIDFGIGIDQNSWYRTGIVSKPKKLVSPITISDGRYYRKSIEIIDTYKSIDTFDTRKKYR